MKMEKIIIISDTHKNQVLLRKACLNENNLTHIFHLGDNYEDLDENFDLIEEKEIIKVPGIYHRGYIDRSIPSIQTTQIKGWKFLLVHNIRDIVINSYQTDFILYGHTHQWTFEKKKNTILINPGHLQVENDRGNPASYAVMEIDENMVIVKFKNIDGDVFHSEIIDR